MPSSSAAKTGPVLNDSQPRISPPTCPSILILDLRCSLWDYLWIVLDVLLLRLALPQSCESVL